MESNGLKGAGTSYPNQSVDAASWSSSQMKCRFKVAPHEIVQMDDNDLKSSIVIGESHLDLKNKQSHLGPMKKQNEISEIDWQNQAKAAGSSSTGLISYSANHNLQNDAMPSSKADLQDFDDESEDEGFDYTKDEDNDFAVGTQLTADDDNQSQAVKFEDHDLLLGAEATVSSQEYSAEWPGDHVSTTGITDDNSIKLEAFKTFDTVKYFSDHHFKHHAVKKTSKDWAKRIQNEWKLLEKDLPDSIYVRVCEGRMDLLRAAIVGPAGTPYHDGLFFFDVQFRADYPSHPPEVHYHSGGLRINPNLYECGKVCLSLLNTWDGYDCERWNPAVSTMLQVLVSIQALVLNEKPYFNEPGHELYSPSVEQKMSLAYNENVFLLSCTTMLYSLGRPPKHFEDFTVGHFRRHGCTILTACKAYLNGTPIGSVIPELQQGTSNCCSNQLYDFESKLKKQFQELVEEFSAIGADCHQFLPLQLLDGSTADGPAATRKASSSGLLRWLGEVFGFTKKW